MSPRHFNVTQIIFFVIPFVVSINKFSGSCNTIDDPYSQICVPNQRRNFQICDYFEELHIVFIEVKLIINNALLTYLYPNAIKTYLIFNNLLFGRQLLCCFNTTSAVIRNLIVLSSATGKINRIRNHF